MLSSLLSSRERLSLHRQVSKGHSPRPFTLGVFMLAAKSRRFSLDEAGDGALCKRKHPNEAVQVSLRASREKRRLYPRGHDAFSARTQPTLCAFPPPSRHGATGDN